MKKNDIFYIVDYYGTKSILKRKVLNVNNGMIQYNFRDSVVQSTTIENFTKFRIGYTSLAKAKSVFQDYKLRELGDIDNKILKLKNKKKKVKHLIPPIIDVVGSYKDLIKAKSK